jgi:peptide/nickel transport system substrate-binding protein
MGTGPWKIDSLDPTRGAELSANPHWWAGKVPIQHISISFFSDETSEALALRAGQIDAVPFVGDPASFASTSGIKPLVIPSCVQGFFSMNTQAPPWNDVHVRRAVAYAINRPDLVKAVGYASPNSTLVPRLMLRSIASQSQIDALLKSLPTYPYSLAKARAELAKSAYPNGFSAQLDFFDYPTFSTVSQVIAAQLQKINIHAQAKNVGFNAWIAELTGPAAKRPTLYSTAGCANLDPSAYPGFMLGSKNTRPGSFNAAAYAPPAVDDLLLAGITTQSPAKRFAVYSKLLQRLAQDVPYVPLFVQDEGAAVSNRFTWPGFDLNTGAVNQPWALGIKEK